MKVTDTTVLFTDALTVMNKAVTANRDKLPFRPLFEAADKYLPDRHIGVALYKDDPNTPFDYFTIRYHEGQFELVEHGKKDPDVTWKVSQTYLESVVNDPDPYIANPARLDWDWLKDRFGISL